MGSALAAPQFLCHPRCRGKKIPFEAFADNSPDQEGYHTPKISRIYLPANLFHIQGISCHPSKVRNVL
jgi:hypothetical protein